ncbi:unnamed protein product [Rotaria sp. Silwood2]|nr:unnamed protein product [Rotaria sp. Silwood2]
MTTTMKNFPLLNEIDEQSDLDNIDWNINAFQTLLTSNLPMTTIFYYAIDVGFRRLESSLYETYWDVTADALNDLSDFLFNTPSSYDIDPYLIEAKCQLLMYASIAIIKLHTLRRRSINEAKMSCATICLLLLEQSKSYETLLIKNQYSSCIHSMRLRYLKRMFIIGQWLSTLSKAQLNDIQSNHEQYVETMIDHLFRAVSLRDKINGFIDNCLLSNSNSGNDFPDNETTSSGFVFIRRFPKFNGKTIEKHSDLMHMGLVNTLNQFALKFEGKGFHRRLTILDMITKEIKSIFCHPAICERLASMLNYFLQHLVGPKRRNLKVRDLNEYLFDPPKLVAKVTDIYLNFSEYNQFCAAVSNDGMSYNEQLFPQAVEVLQRIKYPSERIDEFLQLGEHIKKIAAEQKEEDAAYDDAPDEYLDPITSILMSDPVMLPSSRTILDRTTIARHLLSDQTDPFNRNPLRMQDVIPQNELKQTIEQWKASRRE